LENDLIQATANRNITPWIIVIGHRPLYCSSAGFSNNSAPIFTSYSIQQAFENLFYRYHVDIFFCGHSHAYERIFPTYNNTPTATNYINPSSTAYIVAGAAGNLEGLDNSIWQHPAWSAYQDHQNFGYGLLTFESNTNLKWQYFTSSGAVLVDEMEIVKNTSM